MGLGSVAACLFRPGPSKERAPEGPTPQEPPTMLVRLPRGSGFYNGTVSHPAFGTGQHELSLRILGELRPGSWSGEWTAMGQTDRIVVLVRDGTVLISNESGKGGTQLSGGADEATGLVSGQCTQDGAPGGTFQLRPVSARVEPTPHTVYVRMLTGVAKYREGRLVCARVAGFRVLDAALGLYE